MVDIAFGPEPGPRPDLKDPREAYLEMVRRKRMYGGIISILLHCGQAIYTAVNHTRVRSNCCGRVSEVSLDVEKTTPPGASP
jgi:hypothetical protein